MNIQPPLAGSAQLALMFASACVAGSPSDCSSFDSGIMNQGIAPIYAEYVSKTRAIVDATVSLQMRGVYV